jgi:hypothetical protein
MSHRGPRILGAAFLVLLALLSSDTRAAGPVDVLLDPHAGSAEKFDAVTAALRIWDRLHALLYSSIAAGQPQSPQVLQALNLDGARVCEQMAQILRNLKTPRSAALQTVAYTGLHGPEIRPALEPLLGDADGAVRLAAVEPLERKDVIARMRVPAILRDLRSDDIDRRMIAARLLDELGVEPKEITAALHRAVDRRDMPAREGLIAALESAHATRRNTLDVLHQTADQQTDLTPRAYARAALREVAAAAN